VRGERIVAARVADRLGNAGEFEISARAFVNAAGPWVETVASLAPSAQARLTLSPTKGVHLLLPRLTRQHAIACQSRRDGRIMFIIPWGDCTLVGTTDTDWRGDLADIYAGPADVDYLLEEARLMLPDSSVNAADIVTTFAGVRALVGSDAANPSSRSREHRIVRQGPNLLSIAGGKYTTHRAIAEEVVDQVGGILGRPGAPCRTAVTPLPDHRLPPAGQQISDSPAVYASDIAHVCADEMAVTVADVMRRRTSLALSRHGGPEAAATVAALMAPALGWTDEHMNRSLQAYCHEWKRALP
jgi:glycerol-3-phosphate dehydrogenase